jgi:hypothetical protein
MIYCIDIDGTICSQTQNQQYEKAVPFKTIIKQINNLYECGHVIKFYTARGQSSGKSFEELTLKQLKDWGVKYHSVIFGKPNADVYIDDKSLHPEDFF